MHTYNLFSADRKDGGERTAVLSVKALAENVMQKISSFFLRLTCFRVILHSVCRFVSETSEKMI